jgi:hypothetical protein
MQEHFVDFISITQLNKKNTISFFFFLIGDLPSLTIGFQKSKGGERFLFFLISLNKEKVGSTYSNRHLIL